jgi:rhodanese-related sulfurtransferase
MASRISQFDLKTRLDSGSPPFLVEALPEKYFLEKHLPGALNFPLDAVDRLAPALLPDRSAEIVVYCANAACKNSAIAAARLEALGYTRVRTYHEGKDDWIAAGLPIEIGTRATAAE